MAYTTKLPMKILLLFFLLGFCLIPMTVSAQLNATFAGTGAGESIYSRYYSNYVTARVFNMDVGGQNYEGFCINLYKTIRVGDTVLVNGPLSEDIRDDVDWCAVNYIINTYGNRNGPGALAPNPESASIQAAIWYLVTQPFGGDGPPGEYHFMNDSNSTTPYDAYRTSGNTPRNAVRDRAFAMLNAVPRDGPGNTGNCTFLFPVNVTLTPQTSSILPSGTVDITATVVDQHNNPLSGIGVQFVNAGPGAGTLNQSSGTTGADGNVTIRFTAPVPDTINYTYIDAYLTGNYGTLMFDPGENRQSITTISLVPYSITDQAGVFWNVTPSIKLDKLISTDNQSWVHADTPPINVLQGDSIFYKLVITNDGNVTLTTINLDDDTYTACTPPSTLDPAETFECYLGPVTAVSGLTCNTATANGTYSGSVYEDSDTACFNVTPPYSKSGRVVTNVSGTITGIADVTVWICRDCSDSFPIPTVRVTRTNATGYYEIIDLPAGTYNVSIPRNTSDTADANEWLFSTYLPVIGGPVHSATFTQEPFFVIYRQFSVPPNSTGNDFEFRPLPEGTITGYKFFDYNRNGRKDGNGFYLEGWNITLRYANGTFISQTQTDDFGHYSFTGLNPYYTYNVSEELKTGGWFNTSPMNYIVSFLLNPYGGANEYNTTEEELDARMPNQPYNDSYIWLGYNVRIGSGPNQDELKIFEPLGDWSPGASSFPLSTGGNTTWTSGVYKSFNATWTAGATLNANLSVDGVNDPQTSDPPPSRERNNARPIRDFVIRLHSENPDWYVEVDNLVLKQGSIVYPLVNDTFNWSGTIPPAGQDFYYVVLASNILTNLPAGQDIENGFSLSGDIRFTWPSDDDNQVKGNVLKMDILVGKFQSSYDEVETAIFGNHINGTVSGYKRDETGAGLPYWNITCTNVTLEFFGSNVTNDTGYYIIHNVPPGWFLLNESLDEHPGWVPVPPDVNRTIHTNLTTLNLDNQNFTNQRPPEGNISGYKRNSTALLGLDGWNITLTNYTIGTPAFSTITYTHPVFGPGYYNFTGIPFGIYWLNETNQSGYVAVPPESWSRIVEINSTTQELFDQNFTNQPLGSIYGRKTTQPTAVTSREGWRIDLIIRTGSQTGTIINTTYTDSQGYYNFTNIPWGDYWINETIKPGFYCQTPGNGLGSRSITISGSNLNLTGSSVGFTNRLYGTISGYKLDYDTSQGLQCWTITLSRGTTVVGTTTTNETGYYEFTNLVGANNYWVNETLENCYINITNSNVSTILNATVVNRTINFTNMLDTGSLNITKEADTAGPVYAGQLVTYTIRVCNDGNLTLSSVQVADNLTGPYSIPGTLAKDECNTTTRTYTVTEQDICNGSVTNYAFANATDPCGRGVVTDPNATVTLPALDTPRMNITKEADTPGPVYAGQLVTYTIRVCNDGNLTLNNIQVADNLTGIYSIPGTLAKGECNTTTRTYTVTDQDICNGSVTNYAFANATDPCGRGVVTDPNATVTLPALDTPRMNITKEANTAGPVYAGQLVTYTIRVCNDGNLTLSSVLVVDNRTGPYSIPGTLAKGECNTTTRTYTVTEQDICNGSVTNYVFANATDPCGRGVVTDPNATVTLAASDPGSINITKVANTTGPVIPGQVIGYTITVCNTGNLTVSNVVVRDNRTGNYTVGMLNVSECKSVSPVYTVTEQDICNGSVTNSANATGRDPCGNTLEAGPASLAIPTDYNSSISITKVANTTGPVIPGQVIGYTITVCNTGNLTVSNVVVRDNRTGNYTVGMLNVSECKSVNPVYTVTEQDICNGSVTNSANATGQDYCGTSLDAGPASVAIPTEYNSSISITKVANTTGPVGPGDVIGYTITVCNTGNLTVSNVVAHDNRTGNHIIGTLNVSECKSVNPAYIVTGQDTCNGSVANEAFADATDSCGNPLITAPNATVTIPTRPSGNISGVKFNDLDGNGIREVNDDPLPNWTIRLYQNGNLLASAVTDPNGTYTFTDLPCGIYTLNEVLKAEWTQTAPPGGSYTVEINGTSLNITGRDFGNRQEVIKCCCPTRAYYTYTPSRPKVGQYITFTDKSVGCPVEWNWSFGDGTYSDLKNPTHSYAKAGKYKVIEKIRACGCSGTVYWTSYYRTITVK